MSSQYNKCFAIFFISLSLLSCFTPALAYRVEAQYGVAGLGDRAFNAKPNNIKKVEIMEKNGGKLTHQTPPVRHVAVSIP